MEKREMRHSHKVVSKIKGLEVETRKKKKKMAFEQNMTQSIRQAAIEVSKEQ